MAEQSSRALPLTGNQLKMLALITMTIDHIGSRLFPQILLLRIIGRLALPIFAYMIAEGCVYSKNRKRYLFTIAGLGLFCQIVYYVFDRSLYQCILITFTCSILLIFSIRWAEAKPVWYRLLLPPCVLAAVLFVTEGIAYHVPSSGFEVDYGFAGAMLPVLIHLMPTRQTKWMGTALGLIFLAMQSSVIQWFSLLALIPLALYGGKRGKKGMKSFFYLYYPLHLAAIEGIAMLMQALT